MREDELVQGVDGYSLECIKGLHGALNSRGTQLLRDKVASRPFDVYESGVGLLCKYQRALSHE